MATYYSFWPYLSYILFVMSPVQLIYLLAPLLDIPHLWIHESILSNSLKCELLRFKNTDTDI